MTVIVKCDLCGEEAGPFLTLRLNGIDELHDEQVEEVLGHYHSHCVDRIRDAVEFFADAQQSIDELPVGEPPKPLVTVVGVAAFRALAAAGITRFEDIANHSEGELSDIKGIGPSKLTKVRREMAKQGLRFRVPEVTA